MPDMNGRLDCATNNAGIEGQLAGITELKEEEWDRVLGINLKGTFLCMQMEARAMLSARHARAIVFLCSDDASYITGTTLTPDGGLTLTV